MHVTPGDNFEWSKVLLARARFDGRFELLTSAWERLLGYGRRELTGKTFAQLLGSRTAAQAAIAAILERTNRVAVDVSMRGRDKAESSLRLHRRFDPDDRMMFIVAEENPAGFTYAGDRPCAGVPAIRRAASRSPAA
jgi:hypothetical protein